ncbi:hypothetical protein [Azospirillum argentinense]
MPAEPCRWGAIELAFDNPARERVLWIEALAARPSTPMPCLFTMPAAPVVLAAFV